jgi:hypothetical protein
MEWVCDPDLRLIQMTWFRWIHNCFKWPNKQYNWVRRGELVGQVTGPALAIHLVWQSSHSVTFAQSQHNGRLPRLADTWFCQKGLRDVVSHAHKQTSHGSYIIVTVHYGAYRNKLAVVNSGSIEKKKIKMVLTREFSTWFSCAGENSFKAFPCFFHSVSLSNWKQL